VGWIASRLESKVALRSRLVAELSARTKARPNRVLFDSNLIHAARSAHVLAGVWNQFKQNAIRFFFALGVAFALRVATACARCVGLRVELFRARL
jgi:hypothetical protein